MSFPRASWLTPYKQTALQAMAQGPLDRTTDGWISRKGVEGLWNSHTITWLARQNYCSLNHGKTTAAIMPAGLRKIGMSAEDAA